MLAAFGFEALGVVVGDMYFIDPSPLEGQETPERGVRLELRLVDRADPQGSIYAGVPIAFTRPVWRVDLFDPRRAHRAHWTGPITTRVSTAGNPDADISCPSCRPTRCRGWPSSWPTRTPCWPGRAWMQARSARPIAAGSPRRPGDRRRGETVARRRPQRGAGPGPAQPVAAARTGWL